MDSPSTSRWLVCGLWAVLLTAAGCQNPFAAQQQQHAYQLQQQYAGQINSLQARVNDLDRNNRDLHAQLARSAQQSKLMQDEVDLLRKRLGETASQLADARKENENLDRRLAALKSSTKKRGAAIITANNSYRGKLPMIEVEGVEVDRAQDRIRIRIPADLLFPRGTAQLHRGAYAVLDKIGDVVSKEFPNSQVLIEGHTDNSAVYPAQWKSQHQLSTAQAMAVFDILTQRHHVAPGRLQVAGQGAGRPIVSNGTPEGQARNRRVEIYIAPKAG